MKVLIWFLTFLAISTVNVLLGYATGFTAGFLIIYLLWFHISKKLCQKWDTHVLVREANKKGLTPYEYIKEAIPQSVKDECEEYRADKDVLSFYLKQCIKQKLIASEHYSILLEEYMHPAPPKKIKSKKKKPQEKGE